jgi:uncharacterized protein (DUF2141 family)
MRLLIFLLSILFLLPQQGGKHQLIVTVTGLKPLKGDLYISLHQRPEYFQCADSALMKTKIGVNAETETIIFNKVPAGRYAIAIYHDENLNGIMDANKIGIPKEGYGFSTNPKIQGKPKFEQAAFDLSRNDTIRVKMIYHPVPGTKKDTIK